MSTQREGEPQAAIAATDAVVAAIIIDRLGIADKVDPQGAEQYKSALGMRIVPVRLATQAFLFVGREDDADTLSKDIVKRAGVLGGDKVLMVHTLGYSNEFIFDRHRVDNSAGLTTPSRLVASATMEIFLSIQIQIFYKKDLSDNNIEPCPVQLETWGNRPRRFSSNPVGLNNNTRPGNSTPLVIAQVPGWLQSEMSWIRLQWAKELATRRISSQDQGFDVDTDSAHGLEKGADSP